MCWHAIIIDFITDHSFEPGNDNLYIVETVLHCIFLKHAGGHHGKTFVYIISVGTDLLTPRH